MGSRSLLLDFAGEVGLDTARECHVVRSVRVSLLPGEEKVLR